MKLCDNINNNNNNNNDNDGNHESIKQVHVLHSKLSKKYCDKFLSENKYADELDESEIEDIQKLIFFADIVMMENNSGIKTNAKIYIEEQDRIVLQKF